MCPALYLGSLWLRVLTGVLVILDGVVQARFVGSLHRDRDGGDQEVLALLASLVLLRLQRQLDQLRLLLLARLGPRHQHPLQDDSECCQFMRCVCQNKR